MKFKPINKTRKRNLTKFIIHLIQIADSLVLWNMMFGLWC